MPVPRLISLALLATLACNAGPSTDAPALAAVSLPTELDRVLRDYESAYARRDASALAELFAEDGFLLQPGRPPIQGRTAIAAALEGEDDVLEAIGRAVDEIDDAVFETAGLQRSDDVDDDGTCHQRLHQVRDHSSKHSAAQSTAEWSRVCPRCSSSSRRTVGSWTTPRCRAVLPRRAS